MITENYPYKCTFNPSDSAENCIHDIVQKVIKFLDCIMLSELACWHTDVYTTIQCDAKGCLLFVGVQVSTIQCDSEVVQLLDAFFSNAL